jgi:hypothetical protein
MAASDRMTGTRDEHYNVISVTTSLTSVGNAAGSPQLLG